MKYYTRIANDVGPLASTNSAHISPVLAILRVPFTREIGACGTAACAKKIITKSDKYSTKRCKRGAVQLYSMFDWSLPLFLLASFWGLLLKLKAKKPKKT